MRPNRCVVRRRMPQEWRLVPAPQLQAGRPAARLFQLIRIMAPRLAVVMAGHVQPQALADRSFSAPGPSPGCQRLAHLFPSCRTMAVCIQKRTKGVWPLAPSDWRSHFRDGKDKVCAAAVDVDGIAQKLSGHGRALDMPAGTPRAPRLCHAGSSAPVPATGQNLVVAFVGSVGLLPRSFAIDSI